MKAAFNTLLVLILLAGLGLGGFWIGQIIRGHQTLPAFDITMDDFMPSPPPPGAPDAGTQPYAISPVVAPLARTVWSAELSENAEGTLITAVLPLDDAEKIAPGQDVVFYTRRTQEPLTGNSRVQEVTRDETQARVSFARPDNLPLPTKRISARIITMETVGTKQLPLSALFHDDDGRPYVWKLERASEIDGEYAAFPHHVFAGLKGDSAFEVGPEIQMHEPVLASPPADIQNGQIFMLDIDSKLHTPAITPLPEQARDIQRQENTRLLKQRQQEYEDALGPGVGCNAPLSADGTPAALTTQAGGLPQAGTSGASAGCSSCSAIPAGPPAAAEPLTPAPSTPADAAPASGGGCGSCGGTY